jgi:hypothetical protein
VARELAVALSIGFAIAAGCILALANAVRSRLARPGKTYFPRPRR